MMLTYVRTIIVYLILIFSVRLMGKRQIGQMEASEFVVGQLGQFDVGHAVADDKNVFHMLQTSFLLSVDDIVAQAVDGRAVLLAAEGVHEPVDLLDRVKLHPCVALAVSLFALHVAKSHHVRAPRERNANFGL